MSVSIICRIIFNTSFILLEIKVQMSYLDNVDLLAGLGVWAVFVFWVIFSKMFKHQVQGICGQVH